MNDEFLGHVPSFGEEYYEQRTTIMQKGELFSIIAMAADEEGGALFLFDPREGRPTVALWDDSEEAKGEYKKALRLSMRNGWKLVFSGSEPLNDPRWS